MMRNTVDILGIPVDNLTMGEALEKVHHFLEGSGLYCIYTPNAEIVMAAQRDPELLQALKEADLLVADGAGVVLASRILGRPLPERVAGFDLTKNILRTFKIKLFLFGGRPGVAEVAAQNIMKDCPWVSVVGCINGYFSPEEEKNIIDNINASGADILLVALGAPKQEKWIYRHKDNLAVKICIGVGGSLDVLAGKAKRAPEFFQKNGLEWLYRLCKEPWRYKRMLALPKFVALVLKKRMFG